MKNDIFIARLAQGAVASTLAACLMPQNHTDEATCQPVAHEAVFTDPVGMPSQGTQEGTDKAVVLTVGQAPSQWDKSLEREFRKLALQEATETLSAAQGKRLEQINRWRDRLLCPQPVEEILLQIKRDRLLARMEDLLNDYVDFQETTGKTRPPA